MADLCETMQLPCMHGMKTIKRFWLGITATSSCCDRKKKAATLSQYPQ